MRRKSMRVLAMVLAFVMLISASCVTAFAKLADTKTPQEDENGKYYFTYEQAGTYIMDLIDELLSTINKGKDLKIDLGVNTYTLTLQSYDKALASIYNFRKSTLISAAITLRLAGDLNLLNVDCLSNYSKRVDTDVWDYNCLYNLIHFLHDNTAALQKIANGTFNWGLIDNFVDLPPALTDLPSFLANLAFTKIEELSGKTADESGNHVTNDTVYDPDGKDVDSAINDILLWVFNDLLGDALDFEGGLGLTSRQVNVTQSSFYDLVHSAISSALQNIVVPLLKKVLLNAFDIETSEEYPNGTPDQMNNQTMNLVLGLIEDLLSDAETKPDYSLCTTPGEKIETLLEWFFLEGGMTQYIVIDENGLEITDDFVALLNNLIRVAIPMLQGMDLGALPPEMLHLNELSHKDSNGDFVISDRQCYAILVNMLLSKLIQGYYCNPEASSVAEIGAYALASLCARICPEYNYIEQLDANYADGPYYGMDGNLVSPLPFTSSYTVNGQYLNNGTWTPRSVAYTIPYAALDMGVTVGVYFLDGLITADFSQVPAPGVSATERFEKFVKALLDWAIAKYAPLFDTTFNLSGKYTTHTSVWKEIDEILFSIIPASVMPQSVEDHTTGEGYCSGNSSTVPLKTSGDLICGWLLGSVMDFDIQELVSLLRRNTASDAEFNKPTLTVLIQLIDRIFYIVLNKYAVLPGNQGSRNAIATPTTVNSLGQGANGLLNETQLGNFVKYFITGLGGGSSFNIDKAAAPILRTLLPLIMGSDYIKPYRQNILNSGQIRVSDLEGLIEQMSGQGKVIIPYGKANVDESSLGTYYYVDNNYQVQEVQLNGNNFNPATTYYEEQYVIAQDVDRFTNTATYNKGDGLYVRAETYVPVAVNSSNYNPSASYYQTNYIVATVTEKTNGTYYTAQSESYAVTLPDNFVAGTTYYTHPEVVLGANDEGNYFTKSFSYNSVVLNGTQGGNFNPNKIYYKKIFTDVSFDYMNAYNSETGRMAMGIYSGAGAANGVGSYSSSISGQNFMVFRNQEDFPDALYTFNNFNDFIEDASDFIGEYKDFLEKIHDAYTEWAEFMATNSDDKGPDSYYPFYSGASSYGRRPAEYGVTEAQFNNLQVIKDYINLYGTSSFMTAQPIDRLPTDSSASTTDKDISMYKQWNKYVKDVVKYSNRLNAYYDGINYYLQTAESHRQSYTATKLQGLEWVVNVLCATAYNNGKNGYVDEIGTLIPTYTQGSWTAFKEAYECAVSVINQARLAQPNVKTTQSMITAVRSGLIKAFYGLVKAGELADKTQLYYSIVNARRILADENTDSLFTQASINNLTNTLAGAVEIFEAVIEQDEQRTVDYWSSRVNGAINSLVYLVAPSISIDENYEGNIDVGDSYVISGINYSFIYGLSEGSGLTLDRNVFSINGIDPAGASLVTGSYGSGTGSYIMAKDNGGTTRFVAYGVIYGDVNGDARIDGTDKSAIMAYTLNAGNVGNFESTSYGGAFLKAADIDGDGSITTSDAAYINMVTNYEATINQSKDVTGSRVVLL